MTPHLLACLTLNPTQMELLQIFSRALGVTVSPHCLMVPITNTDPPNGQVLLAEFSTFRAAEWGLSTETDCNQLKKRLLQDKMP
jgi:hypothetical protein